MGESYKYYFVMVICSFVRGNVMYILSKIDFKERDANCCLSERNFGCAGYGIYLYGVELLLYYSFVIGGGQ